MELNNSILFFAGKEPTRNTIASATNWGYRIEANDRMIQSNFFLYPSPARHSPETIETDDYTIQNLGASSQGDELEQQPQAAEAVGLSFAIVEVSTYG
jgi:hypothetical protein